MGGGLGLGLHEAAVPWLVRVGVLLLCCPDGPGITDKRLFPSFRCRNWGNFPTGSRRVMNFYFSGQASPRTMNIVDQQLFFACWLFMSCQMLPIEFFSCYLLASSTRNYITCIYSFLFKGALFSAEVTESDRKLNGGKIILMRSWGKRCESFTHPSRTLLMCLRNW